MTNFWSVLYDELYVWKFDQSTKTGKRVKKKKKRTGKAQGL